MKKQKERKTRRQPPESVNLRQLALDIVEGKVFTTNWHMPKEALDLVPQVFMPILFMTAAQKRKVGRLGLLYEYIDKAGPWSINGYPIFFSMRVLNRRDLRRLVPLVLEAKQQREAFVRGT